MSADSLIVTSPTGVDVELAIAGPGSRSYAFIIDWHVRLIGALAWFAVVSLLETGATQLNFKTPAAVVALTIAPAIAIYFLYHPLVEVAMRGRTPGKRMAGVRIVNRQGGTPSVLALLIRNAFRLIDCLPVFYGVGLCMTIFTRQRVRLGDLAAGTLLVHDGDSESKALAQLATLSLNPALDADTLALGNDLLLRWNDLQSSVRCNLARELLARIASANGSPAVQVTTDTRGDEILKERLRGALAGKPA